MAVPIPNINLNGGPATGGQQETSYGGSTGSTMIMGNSASWQNYVLVGVAVLAAGQVVKWLRKGK